MTAIHTTFGLNEKSQIASIDFWDSVLNPISIEFWSKNKDCIIQEKIDDVDFTLIIGWNNKDRWSLQIDRWSNKIANVNSSFYPMIGSFNPSDFVTLDSGMMVPSCSFVDAKHLGGVIVDFVKDPSHLPDHVPWVNSGDLHWPEDF